MKLALFVLALPLFGQTIGTTPFPCKGSFIGSTAMKGIYGGRTTVFQLDVICRNNSIVQSQPITGALVSLAMPTINTMPAGIANLLLTQTFNNQPSQQFSRDATLGLGVLGALEGAGGKLAIIGTGPFGWIVAGVVTATQYLIQYFTKTVPLNLTNQCDSIGAGSGGVIIPSGGTFECTAFVSKPPKTATPLPSTITFDLLAGWTPSPLPPPPPVQLRQPQHSAEERAPKCSELTEDWMRAHPTAPDPCYVENHPPGYWKTGPDQDLQITLIAKGK